VNRANCKICYNAWERHQRNVSQGDDEPITAPARPTGPTGSAPTSKNTTSLSSYAYIKTDEEGDGGIKGVGRGPRAACDGPLMGPGRAGAGGAGAAGTVVNVRNAGSADSRSRRTRGRNTRASRAEEAKEGAASNPSVVGQERNRRPEHSWNDTGGGWSYPFPMGGRSGGGISGGGGARWEQDGEVGLGRDRQRSALVGSSEEMDFLSFEAHFQQAIPLPSPPLNPSDGPPAVGQERRGGGGVGGIGGRSGGGACTGGGVRAIEGGRESSASSSYMGEMNLVDDMLNDRQQVRQGAKPGCVSVPCSRWLGIPF
jgi:hypothetical protein